MAVGALALPGPRANAALPKLKIIRIRTYKAPNGRPIFNQSNDVVNVETD